MRTRLALAVALLTHALAGCGGSSSDGPAHSCTIQYSGGVSESVWCDAPVVRSNGSGGYVLQVMAFRGAPLDFDQAGEVRVVFNTRPLASTDYGWTGGTTDAAVTPTLSWETRKASGGTDTHEAVAGSSGAFTVNFSSIPADDGLDPTGLGGIGTVHGTFSATLVAISTGSDVNVAGTF